MAHPFALLQRLALPCTGVLQIGASFGQEVEAIAASGAKMAVLVEPLPGPFQKLSEKIRPYRYMIAVRALCSSVAGETVNFQIASNGGMSSSILEPEAHKTIYPNVEFPQTIQIKTTSVDVLMGLLAEKIGRAPAEINTLLMDVQGAEHLVLQGAEKTLSQIDYIFCEVSLGGLYKGDLSVEALQAYLMPQGFRVCWLEMNRRGWGDALFIREKFFDVMRVKAESGEKASDA
ncbi:MAG: FkbM family methyltransferase [Chakrabartia sp.]